MLQSTPETAPRHQDLSPHVVSSATALPRHRYSQHELAEVARQLMPEMTLEPKLLERFFQRVGVEQRYLALPAERYSELNGFGSRNKAWLEVALELGQTA